MIVGPNRGVFFVGTVLMCAVSLYGAESLSATDPMTRIFVGEPNRLTLPPSFPQLPAEPALSGTCDGPQARTLTNLVEQGQTLTPNVDQDCEPANLEPVRQRQPSNGAASATDESRIIAQPASTGSTIERP